MTTSSPHDDGGVSRLATACALVLSLGLSASCERAGGEEADPAAGGGLSLGEGLLAAEFAGDAGEPNVDASCCETEPVGAEALEGLEESLSNMNVPDVELVDQDGKTVRFYSDLVEGKLVAINFIFTTCTTICPPLTANFAELQQLEAHRGNENFSLISISVDPVTDTPQRMKAWSQKFGAKPGWTFLTGEKHDVDGLLKALGVFTPLKEDHSPLVLVGNDPAGRWTRAYGLSPPAKLAEVIDRMAEAPALVVDEWENESAHEYFTDVELINQDGEVMRLYGDLMKNKVVVIDCFFTECTGICPVMANTMTVIQAALGDRLGDSVHMLSISVDSETDTPEKLKAFAQRYEAEPGWYFLSGEKSKVQEALHKFGFTVESREQHSNLILIGNDRTGLWKKALGLAKAEEIVPIVESVIADVGTDVGQ